MGGMRLAREAEFAAEALDQALGQAVEEVAQHRRNGFVADPVQGGSREAANLRRHVDEPLGIRFRHGEGIRVQAPVGLSLVVRIAS